MAEGLYATQEILTAVYKILGESLGIHPSIAKVEEFEATTGVTGSTDVTGIAQSTDHRGVGQYSLEYDKSGATSTAGYIEKTLDSIDLEIYAETGRLVWHLYVSDLTNVDYVRIYLGTDGSNHVYWETADASLSNGWNRIELALNTPTDYVGTGIIYGDITFIRAEVVFDNAAHTLNNIRVDSVTVIPTERVHTV